MDNCLQVQLYDIAFDVMVITSKCCPFHIVSENSSLNAVIVFPSHIASGHTEGRRIVVKMSFEK